MSDHPFTWFRRRELSRSGLRVVLDTEELAANLRDAAPIETTKDEQPLICASTFRGDHRTNANVEAVHALGLDVDKPEADPPAFIARVREALGSVEVFAYSTASSVPGAFKMRALIPYDRAATAEEHRASWAFVAHELARAGVSIDRACSDPARGFYVWGVPKSGAYFHAHVAGDPWPVGLAAEIELLGVAAEAKRRARLASQRRAKRKTSTMASVERARRYVAAMPAGISGAGGHGATFAVARRLVQDFELSEADAWDVLLDFNQRCEPPWSERELRHKLASAQRARVRVDMETDA